MGHVSRTEVRNELVVYLANATRDVVAYERRRSPVAQARLSRLAAGLRAFGAGAGLVAASVAVACAAWT